MGDSERAEHDDQEDSDFGMDHDENLVFLASSFEQLPEAQVSISKDRSIYAQYAQPTDRYGHGILGDRIEAGQLVVLRDGVTYTHTLDERFVFEDIRPRLSDVDSDGELEVVTVRTDVSKGAGIMIYKIEDRALSEYAWVDEIGTPSRWLNIAAIYDLDGDGIVELAWVQTPHIGGILRVARISRGVLSVLSESTLYSNHAVGERNLCLSTVTAGEDKVTLYVPTHDRSQIVGLRFTGNGLVRMDIVEHQVDFSRSLSSQYDFSGVVQGGDNCADP